MAAFCEVVKQLLGVPVVGAPPDRAEVIARKLRMAEIEVDDIKYLDGDDVKQITGVTAERVRLRRLIENVDVAQRQWRKRWTMELIDGGRKRRKTKAVDDDWGTPPHEIGWKAVKDDPPYKSDKKPDDWGIPPHER